MFASDLDPASKALERPCAPASSSCSKQREPARFAVEDQVVSIYLCGTGPARLRSGQRRPVLRVRVLDHLHHNLLGHLRIRQVRQVLSSDQASGPRRRGELFRSVGNLTADGKRSSGDVPVEAMDAEDVGREALKVKK